ncbi:MAG: hypothetical protein A2939_02515 [Parcubacteria group bacterium RIFCSPLOWO2_01_FULL_48_18]|nr:MAG: hypothetical protein A3J67_05725 [Parcubacteria group bacterium RIFCSPHIGHO2_02_FULL_48_10b]OHB23308.1 MAG: hypothetical protein A2939_02515 [Parcubacteria group bacterium RIFCSPLOWO2_01_FULL_48_18]
MKKKRYSFKNLYIVVLVSAATMLLALYVIYFSVEERIARQARQALQSFAQSDWSAGPGYEGPVDAANANLVEGFSDAHNIDWGSEPGVLKLKQF